MSAGVTLKDAQMAKARAVELFRPLVGEVAVGIMPVGRSGYGLKINLMKAPDEGVSLPDEIDGVPVRIEVVGTIRKR